MHLEVMRVLMLFPSTSPGVSWLFCAITYPWSPHRERNAVNHTNQTKTEHDRPSDGTGTWGSWNVPFWDLNERSGNDELKCSAASNSQLSWPMCRPSRPLRLEAGRRWRTLVGHPPVWRCSWVHCQVSESSLGPKRQTCHQQCYKSNLLLSAVTE